MADAALAGLPTCSWATATHPSLSRPVEIPSFDGKRACLAMTVWCIASTHMYVQAPRGSFGMVCTQLHVLAAPGRLQQKLELLAVHLSLKSPDAFRCEPDLAVHALKLLLEPSCSRWCAGCGTSNVPSNVAKPV